MAGENTWDWNGDVNEDWHGEGKVWPGFVRTLWTSAVGVVVLCTIFLFEYVLDRKVKKSGPTARCHFIASLSFSVATAVVLVASAKWLYHHAVPWAKEWQLFLIVTATSFIWAMLRTNNANREFGNMAAVVTACLALATPWRGIVHIGVLFGIFLSILWKLFKIQYPWMFGAWVEEISYSHQHFSTGDVWMITGTAQIAGGIKYFTNSNISHCGILVVDPPDEVLQAYHITDCERDPRGVYLLESCGGFDDVTPCRAALWREDNDTRTDGVQMNSLLKTILMFRSHEYNKQHFFARTCGCCNRDRSSGTAGHEEYVCIHRRLQCIDDEGKSAEDINKARWTEELISLVVQCARKTYEGDLMQLVMGTLHANPGDDTEYFCSELVAHCLQAIGAMRKDMAADNYVPADFEGRKWYSKFFESCGFKTLSETDQPPGMEPLTDSELVQSIIDKGKHFVNGVKGRWSLALQQRIKYRPRDDAKLQRVDAGTLRQLFPEKQEMQLHCSRCQQQMFDFSDPKNDDFLRTTLVPPGGKPEVGDADVHCEIGIEVTDTTATSETPATTARQQ